jgi:hypothetical protein
MGALDKFLLVASMTRLIGARRAHLADLASDWNPRGEADVEAYLKEAVRSIVPDVRRAS